MYFNIVKKFHRDYRVLKLLLIASLSLAWIPKHKHNHEDLVLPSGETFMEVCMREKTYVARSNKKACKERQEYREVFCYEPEVEKRLDDESLELYYQFCDTEEFCHYEYVNEYLDIQPSCVYEAAQHGIIDLVPMQ